jgi:hypothetical protein
MNDTTVMHPAGGIGIGTIALARGLSRALVSENLRSDQVLIVGRASTLTTIIPALQTLPISLKRETPFS